MVTTAQGTDCAKPTGRDCAEGTEAVEPFTAPLYHYGMLLGVEDMDAALAYPRGKMRLHSSWLHREGVVWGFDVGFDRPGHAVCDPPKAVYGQAHEGKPAEAPKPTYELRVCPGLALDGAGRELHLDSQVCLDLGRWYEEETKERTPEETKERRRRRLNKDDFDFGDTTCGVARLTARVMVGYRCCLARPVPAMVGSCEGAERDTAYSRAQETVELWLEPVPEAPWPPPPPYTRLRVLFGIATREEEELYPRVKHRRDHIRRQPADEQPPAYLKAFRRYAARDAIDLRPAGEPGEPVALWPEPDTTAVPLAVIECVDLRRGPDGRWRIDPDSIGDKSVDVTVRPSHVATRTIQELLAGPIAPVGGPQGADAGGPRLVEETLCRHERSITFSTDKPLDPPSVDEEAFSVTEYSGDGGWASYDLKAAVDKHDHCAVTVSFREKPGPIGRLRLIVRGTGPKPLLGTSHIPFAGKAGDEVERPGTKQDGVDYVAFI
jgi:hypothetical protein